MKVMEVQGIDPMEGSYIMEGMPLKGILSPSLPALFEVSNRYTPIMACYATIPHNNVAKWPRVKTSEIMRQNKLPPLKLIHLRYLS